MNNTIANWVKQVEAINKFSKVNIKFLFHIKMNGTKHYFFAYIEQFAFRFASIYLKRAE